jgi:ribosomal protein L10
MIKGKIGFIFAEENYVALKKIVESEVIKMPAKAKVIAPCNVWIKCMNTNIDPGQINEF